MIEVVPNVISSDLGESIENLLLPNVEGTDVLAKTTNRELIELTLDALHQFCRNLELRRNKTVTVFELYKSGGWKKVAHRIHGDDRPTFTLGLSSDVHNNAGTVVLGCERSDLQGKHNSEVFHLHDSGDHLPATLNGDFADDSISLTQAPRYGAIIITPRILHCAPHLHEDTARLLLIH